MALEARDNNCERINVLDVISPYCAEAVHVASNWIGKPATNDQTAASVIRGSRQSQRLRGVRGMPGRPGLARP